MQQRLFVELTFIIIYNNTCKRKFHHIFVNNKKESTQMPYSPLCISLMASFNSTLYYVQFAAAIASSDF